VSVLEDEVVPVERGERLVADPAGHLTSAQRGYRIEPYQYAHCRDVVHVRLLDHRAHRLRDAPLFKLVPAVLLPDRLAVEVRPAELHAEEHERVRVRERGWAW
jgi:hypothetical protein